MIKVLVWVVLLGTGVQPQVDGAAKSAVAPTPTDVHIIYLHGRLAEGAGPRPVHPEFGRYDYPGILEALGSRGAKVWARQRPAKTNTRAHAGEVVALIEALIEDGVPERQIVVVGFSKGGAIAFYVSSALQRPTVRFAILAACSAWLERAPEVKLTANVFSIFEQSDELAGTCGALRGRSAVITKFRELELTTGLRHGAFYRPRVDWVRPLLEWVHGVDAGGPGEKFRPVDPIR